MANVLDKLAKRLRPKAKQALREIMHAPTKAGVKKAIDAFVSEFEAKYQKAAACLETPTGRTRHLAWRDTD